MMLTNVKRWYNDREILPAIGQSDHLSVLLIPSNNPPPPIQSQTLGSESENYQIWKHLDGFSLILIEIRSPTYLRAK